MVLAWRVLHLKHTVLLASFLLACSLVLAERGDPRNEERQPRQEAARSKGDTVLQLAGTGLSAFKRADRHSKQMQSASLLQVDTSAGPPSGPPSNKPALAATVEAVINQVKQDAVTNAEKGEAKAVLMVNDIDDVTPAVNKMKVAGATPQDLVALDESRGVAAKEILDNLETRRAQSKAAWAEAINREQETLSEDMFPEELKHAEEKPIRWRYGDFLADLQTFKLGRMPALKTDSAAIMTANNEANELTHNFSDRVQKLGGAVSNTMVTAGLNHVYANDEIHSSINESKFLAKNKPRPVHIFFPLMNRLAFKKNSNNFTDDAKDYVKNVLKDEIEAKIQKYKGYHFTFCVEAQSVSERDRVQKEQSWFKKTFVKVSDWFGSKPKVEPPNGEEFRKDQGSVIEARQETISSVIKNLIDGLPDAGGHEFNVVRPNQTEEHYGAENPLGAILMVAIPPDDHEEGDEHAEHCGKEEFAAMGASSVVSEQIQALTAESGSGEPISGVTDELPDQDKGTYSNEHLFAQKMKELMKELKEDKVKYASVADCLTHIKGKGAGWWGELTTQIKPTPAFVDYMNEQLAYWCNIASMGETLKRINGAVVEEEDTRNAVVQQRPISESDSDSSNEDPSHRPGYGPGAIVPYVPPTSG